MATTSQAAKLESAQKSVHERIERRRFASTLLCNIHFKDFGNKFRRFSRNFRLFRNSYKFLFSVRFSYFQFSFLGKCCVASMSVNFRHFIMPLHEGRSVQYLHSSLFSLFAIYSLRIKELPVPASTPYASSRPETYTALTHTGRESSVWSGISLDSCVPRTSHSSDAQDCYEAQNPETPVVIFYELKHWSLL